MSTWTHVTGAFYVCAWDNNAAHRVREFMKAYYEQLPQGSEGGLKWDVLTSNEISCNLYEGAGSEHQFGVVAIHLYGNLRDTVADSVATDIVEFMKTLRSTYRVQLAEVCVRDGCWYSHMFWIDDVGSPVHDIDLKSHEIKVIK